MNNPLDSPAATSSSVAGEVAARFGVLPNFFRLAADAPEITENLWGFAKFGYLDNPLPSLLKERLFVYLSQFCEVRYCLSRHVGFLVGLGRPAGDLQCPPETVEQIVRLIRRPFPRGEALRPHLEFCEQLGEPLADWPASETFAEEAIFACTTHVFLQTAEAPRCLAALRHALASDALEHLLVFITFVRTAHFWTKVHPELQQEQDILDLLSVHEALAECVLLEPEESNSETTQILLNELIELRKEAEQAELLRVTLASIGDAVIVTDALGKVTTLNVVAEQLAGWSKEEAYGKRAEDVFQIVHEHTRQPAECPARTVLREGRAAGPSEHTLLIAKGGASYPVDHSAASIRNKGGSVVGCVLVFRDVTDRRRAEQQLQQSELRYRLVGQAANDAIWDWDLKTNHVAWNEGLQTRFGFPQEAVGDDSLWWVDHLHPDDRDRVVTGIHAAIDDGSELWEEEYHFRRADGGYAAVLDRGRIVRDDAGSPVRMVGSMLDLTEKRKIESDLREARSRLESTLAAAEIGTWEYDPVREVVKADQNLARMFGVSPDRAANGQLASYLDAIHPDDRQRVMKSIQHALAKADNYETEYRLLGADNSVRWVVARGRVERNAAGHAVSLPGVVMDISERKKYEKALQASEERLHLALESAELGAWNVDPETHHLTSDERFRIIFQGRTDPLTYEQAFAAIHPDDQERVRASVAAAIDPSTLAPYDEEYRVVHAGGAVRWVFAKGRANFDHVGDEQRLVSFDGTVMDITEQRQLQDDLQRVAASLSESHRRKDEFIATLSHELRNPLAPIRSGLEAMKSAAGDPELLEEIRTTMERQTQQLITLVDDLLDVSRITSGKLQLRRRRVELSEVVRNAVEAARPFVEDAEHNLTVTAPDEKIFLHADPHRLAQVLSNLLNNSTKYTPAGGSIRLTAEQDGPEVVIAVEDSGLGIPREMQERIFEMFAQVDRPQEKGYTGLGIGLSLVKSLVELHDGRIEVRSEGPGLGSEFRVRIPLSTEPDAEPASPREAPVTPPGQRKKVLVVDDNKAAAKMLKVVVGSLGAEVRTAHDGLDAIDAAAEFRPDVVLMDIGMPRINGYDAAAGIREQPWGKSMVLVALTGWGQDEDKQRTREAGFDHHLVKPADAEAIRRVLSDVPSSDA